MATMSLPRLGAGLLRSTQARLRAQPGSRFVRLCASGSEASTAAAATQQPSKQQAPGSGYKLPPDEITQIIDAPPEPGLTYSPDRKHFLQLFRPPALPSIVEMSRPELKLAGLRVDPDFFARSKMGYSIGLAVLPSDQMVPAAPDNKFIRHIKGYPEGSCINYAMWSPDAKHITFTTRSPGASPTDPPRAPLELWVADAATGQARRLLGQPDYVLNTIFDDYQYLDDDNIVACVLPKGVTAESAPKRPSTGPQGPRISDNTAGLKSQNRTWPDLLKDEHDEKLFEHYGQSELVRVNIYSGSVQHIAPPRLYTDINVSPDGRYMMVGWLERPYSYSVPCGRFPRRVQLWRADGSLVRELAYLPLAEDIPIAFNSCRKGPRGFDWRADKPCELSWIEAQDGGDANVEASPRDIMYMLNADEAAAAAEASSGGQQAGPESNGGPLGQPRIIAQTDLRCGGIGWGDDDLAILFESWWKTRRMVWWTLAPGRPQEEKKVLFDRNYEDVYNDPGAPLARRTKWGTYVLAKLNGERKLLMEGIGASEEGNKPFLSVLDLDTKETRKLWQSGPPYFETPGSILNDTDYDKPISLDNLQMLWSRESATQVPQSFVRTWTNNGTQCSEVQVTQYPHPHPQLADLQREVLRYPRDDGVMLTATLYTPPGYKADRDGPLPCLLWAYPREFKSKDAAGQMRRSPYQFSYIGSQSPMLWLARGYAVLDGPTLPIVAEGDEEPNDTFVEQLCAGAKAVVAECVGKGIVDPKRISVGGHSYGAFMAANLAIYLPDMFACAIARSGAYNRTLTPFGFQNEERTLWQAPDVYAKMSPFMNADKARSPILLIHGEEDNNPGTFPLQSERLYAALKGHGVTSRCVILPHESHGYRARESVLHATYEQDQWMERFAGFGRTDPNYCGDTA